MKTGSTAGQAILAEMWALAAESRGASFDLVVTQCPLWIWQDGAVWSASFERGPDMSASIEARAIRPDTYALKQAGGYRREAPGIVDLVAADTTERFLNCLRVLNEEAR